VVQVRELGPTDLVLHSRRPVLKPFVAPECVVLTNLV
jgi:hypothetical protein